MTPKKTPEMFLFTFRLNEAAQGQSLVEVFVEELADYDPAPAGVGTKCSWFGKEAELPGLLETLGFEEFDIKGVLGALNDHRDADRRYEVTLEQLYAAGFQDVSKELASSLER